MAKIPLNEESKVKLAWTHWERVVWVAYKVFLISVVVWCVCTLVVGSSNVWVGIMVFGWLMYWEMFAVIPLTIFSILLTRKLSPRNYDRVVPMVFGTIMIEIFWAVLLLCETMSHSSSLFYEIGSFLELFGTIVICTIVIMATILYKHAYKIQLLTQNTETTISNEKCALKRDRMLMTIIWLAIAIVLLFMTAYCISFY